MVCCAYMCMLLRCVQALRIYVKGIFEGEVDMSVSFATKNHENRVSIQSFDASWGVGGQTFSLTNSLVRNFNYTTYIFEYFYVKSSTFKRYDIGQLRSISHVRRHGHYYLSCNTYGLLFSLDCLASLQAALFRAVCTVAKCCAQSQSFPERNTAPLKKTSNIANCPPRKAPRSVVGDFWRGCLGRVLS